MVSFLDPGLRFTDVVLVGHINKLLPSPVSNGQGIVVVLSLNPHYSTSSLENSLGMLTPGVKIQPAFPECRGKQ